MGMGLRCISMSTRTRTCHTARGCQGRPQHAVQCSLAPTASNTIAVCPGITHPLRQMAASRSAVLKPLARPQEPPLLLPAAAPAAVRGPGAIPGRGRGSRSISRSLALAEPPQQERLGADDGALEHRRSCREKIGSSFRSRIRSRCSSSVRLVPLAFGPVDLRLLERRACRGIGQARPAPHLAVAETSRN